MMKYKKKFPITRSKNMQLIFFQIWTSRIMFLEAAVHIWRLGFKGVRVKVLDNCTKGLVHNSVTEGGGG